MHPNSMEIMAKFAKANKKKGETVLDIGSFDQNGTYRDLFKGCKYIGVDIQEGPNVDILWNSKEWKKLKNADMVISGQTLEHVQEVPKLMNSVFDVLKPGGLACFIAPSEGPGHDYPIWNGNWSEKRMTEAFESAGFEIISCTISQVPAFYDNCCIARKPETKKRK